MARTAITASFTFTPREARASYWACHRAMVIVRWLFPGVFVLLGILALDVFPIVVGVSLFAFLELLVRRQLRIYTHGPVETTVHITEDHYRVEGPDRYVERSWTSFVGAKIVGRFWVLRISSAASMALPTAALTENQTEQFTMLLRRKGLLSKTAA